jgi:photosystem II stability/assembly factor-like uncharacterized protein
MITLVTRRAALTLVMGASVAALTGAPARRAAGQASGAWEPLSTGTTASLRGLHAVSARVVWASGTGGTVIHTTDGGTTWRVDTIPNASGFDVRAVHARGDMVAHAAATAGRIWRTLDGGRTWSLRYHASDTTVFLDAIAFWDDRHGIALGDPIGGRFFVLLTDDGGETWREAPAESRPVTLEGEAAFAASGTSLVVVGIGSAWIGSGGRAARVHRSLDRGRTWQVAETPIQTGTGSNGIFSLSFATPRDGIAVGGDYRFADSTRATAAVTRDGGVTWEAARAMPRGYRSGVAARFRRDSSSLAIAVGTNGTDVSQDGGVSWAALDGTGFNAVVIAPSGVAFAAGDRGRVARLDTERLRSSR